MEQAIRILIAIVLASGTAAAQFDICREHRFNLESYEDSLDYYRRDGSADMVKFYEHRIRQTKIELRRERCSPTERVSSSVKYGDRVDGPEGHTVSALMCRYAQESLAGHLSVNEAYPSTIADSVFDTLQEFQSSTCAEDADPNLHGIVQCSDAAELREGADTFIAGFEGIPTKARNHYARAWTAIKHLERKTCEESR